jgi:hypothetical protein
MTLMSHGKMSETFRDLLDLQVQQVRQVQRDRLVTKVSLETLQLLLILHRYPQTTAMLGLTAATVKHTFTMIRSGLKLVPLLWAQLVLRELLVRQVQLAT